MQVPGYLTARRPNVVRLKTSSPPVAASRLLRESSKSIDSDLPSPPLPWEVKTSANDCIFCISHQTVRPDRLFLFMRASSSHTTFQEQTL